ncbi:MarR family winged helix-turn-helix transcriptional regulator [Bacillus weihaiensis]|uniref:MarR family transcriptional regulator n=1 Tax=Bacillus weihaiensis TaxID=1547283 RepID=A0A1L3MND3_9BACI|nr:MarR family transcriptional regulator [Bacillus weihaiensis]APH03841.1 MarR family transcriptional regulator [Bacillus weihaiensis]
MSKESLSLENQICFKLYTAEKEINKIYRSLLQGLGVTYPQYLALLVLWEHNHISVKQLGDKLFLDSGTLTPMLKRMESNGFITRERSTEDERVVYISLTEKGKELKQEATCIPELLLEKLSLESTDISKLNEILSMFIAKVK